MGRVTRQKEPLVVLSFDKRVSRVAISLYWWQNNGSMFVFKFDWGIDRDCSTFDCSFVNCPAVLNGKGNIFGSITMFGQMITHFFRGVLIINWTEYENSPLVVSQDVWGNRSFSSFKTFVSEILEAKSTGVKRSSLLSIANPKRNVV
jgi:hypothetical protein